MVCFAKVQLVCIFAKVQLVCICLSPAAPHSPSPWQVNSNLQIAKDTRRKQGLTALLVALLRLQQASNLQRALKWVPAALPGAATAARQ